jgi:hypothetical protein
VGLGNSNCQNRVFNLETELPINAKMDSILTKDGGVPDVKIEYALGEQWVIKIDLKSV